MLFKRLILSLAIALVAGGVGSSQDHFDPSTLDRLHWPLIHPTFQSFGSQSCASSSCHGGPRPAVVQPRVSRGNEYPLWIENDPHAQSWRTFCSDESVAMMRRLNILGRDGDVVDQAGYDNCLACHNPTRRSSPHVNQPDRNGVGCSGCHGPDEQWIGTHYQDGWNADAATVQGFVNTDDLLTRARMCATCHVGDQDRDMNHDLIAAGHPALRYEFATFHARQPKHWRDVEAGAEYRYEAQLWLAGQIAALDASMSLLQKRGSAGGSMAGDVATTEPAVSRWPEFSAYDCASCHHTLGFDNERRPLEVSTRPPFTDKPAVAIASMWNDIGVRWIIDRRIESGVAVSQDHRLVDAIDAMRSTLESGSVPEADQIAATATLVRRALSDWVDSVYVTQRFEFEADDLASLVTFAAGQAESYRTWESAAQLYLAAVAARNAWPEGPSGPAFLVANRLRDGLRYAGQTDIPRFAKRVESDDETSSSPLSRSEIAQLSVELAAWLGGGRLPDLSPYQDDQDQTDSMREQLRSIIDRVNETLQQTRDQRIKVAPAIDDQPNREMEPKPADAPLPKPRPKTPQELLDELRKRRINGGNPFGDD